MAGPSGLTQATAEAAWKSKGWDSVPLFMKSLPSLHDPDASLDKKDIALEALRSLVYESSPNETVETLKNQGNEYFVDRRFREAFGFYNQAIQQVIETDRGDEVSDELKRITYSNRAACQLELHNYGSCIRDCATVLSLQIPSPTPPVVLKSLYRSAKALFALSKFDDALEALNRFSVLAAKEKVKNACDNKLSDGEKLRHEIEMRKGEVVYESWKVTEHERRKGQWGLALQYAFQLRNLVLTKDISFPISSASIPPGVNPASFDPKSVQLESSLEAPFPSQSTYKLKPQNGGELWSAPKPTTPIVYPVYILRPCSTPPIQDLIASWHEDVTVKEQLNFMVEETATTTNDDDIAVKEDVYVVTQAKRVIKCGQGLTLKRIIQGAYIAKYHGGADGVPLREGWYLQLIIVPHGRIDWMAEFKKARGGKVE